MRCAVCHSYIPEGLASPVTCPQCGRQAGAEAPKSAPAAEASRAAPAPPRASSEPFAPYFTIRTTLAYSVAAAHSQDPLLEPAPGSLSFGAEGFSIVFDEGRHWKRIQYRDLEGARLDHDRVIISEKGATRDSSAEGALTLFHPWLPRVFAGARRRRASVFIELLERVRGGLTPTEISYFQHKLR
jgi:hypothetical protein